MLRFPHPTRAAPCPVQATNFGTTQLTAATVQRTVGLRDSRAGDVVSGVGVVDGIGV
jgi:hypothetical protein